MRRLNRPENPAAARRGSALTWPMLEQPSSFRVRMMSARKISMARSIARIARRRHAIGIAAAQQTRLGAHRHGLDHIGAAADAAVEQHFGLAAHRFHDARQHAQAIPPRRPAGGRHGWKPRCPARRDRPSAWRHPPSSRPSSRWAHPTTRGSISGRSRTPAPIPAPPPTSIAASGPDARHHDIGEGPRHAVGNEARQPARMRQDVGQIGKPWQTGSCPSAPSCRCARRARGCRPPACRW